MTEPNPVVVTDIEIPFWRAVLIIVKWSIAAIPAMIILAVIYSVIFALIAALLAALGVHMPHGSPA
jgi:hypothetical protein